MKQHIFENIEENETFGPLKLRLDEHLLRGFAFAVEDYSNSYFKTAQDCGPLAHPALLAKKLLHIFMTKYDPQGVSAVHIKDEIEILSPPRFGDEVSISAKYSDIFVHKGRTCAVLEGEAHDSKGKLLLRHRSVEIIPSNSKYPEKDQKIKDGISNRRVNTVLPKEIKIAKSPGEAKIGMTLPPRKRTISQDQMSVFVGANEGWKNIHTDIDVAKAAGFENTIMSGMIQACWFVHLMTDFFGQSFMNGGQLGITFLKNVFAQETIDLHAVISSISNEGDLEIEFWSTNKNNEITAVGRAIGNAK